MIYEDAQRPERAGWGGWDDAAAVTNCCPKGVAPNGAFIIVAVQPRTRIFS